jgi:hypothetical protein
VARSAYPPHAFIQAYQVVDQVLRLAVRARYITGNPADHVQLPRKNAREKFALTPAGAPTRQSRRGTQDDGLHAARAGADRELSDGP